MIAVRIRVRNEQFSGCCVGEGIKGRQKAPVQWWKGEFDAVADRPFAIVWTPVSVADELKTSGLKPTWPRLEGLDVFRHSKQRHLGPEDVCETLLEQGAAIGSATVYRVPMRFEQAGLL